jgi:hypothetical protein
METLLPKLGQRNWVNEIKSTKLSQRRNNQSKQLPDGRAVHSTILNLPNMRQATPIRNRWLPQVKAKITAKNCCASVAKLVLMPGHPSLMRVKPRRGLFARIHPRRSTALAVLAAVFQAIPILAAGQSSPLGTTSPGELVRLAVARELADSQDPSVKHQFRSLKQGPRGSQTKLYVETRDAMAGMVIAYDDRPVTQAELGGEEARLQGLIDHPELLRRKQAQEKEDKDRTLRLVKAWPDAFLYEYDGTETATAEFGKAGDPLVRLKFRPNPHYNPPSRLEQVLAGMQGTVLIDAEQHRIAKIDGTLFKDMTFGWGFLARLEKGGHFLVEHSDLGDGSWEVRRMTLNFTGKILLFKGFTVASDEVFSDFRRVPADTTFAQGVGILKAEQSKLAQNSAGHSH